MVDSKVHPFAVAKGRMLLDLMNFPRQVISVWLIFLLTLTPTLVSAQKVEVTIGQRRTVISDALVQPRPPFRIMPDGAITVIHENPLVYVMSIGQGKSIIVKAKPDFTPLAYKIVLEPSGKEGVFDKDYAGIMGAVRLGNKIVAVYHAEQDSGYVRELGQTPYYGTIGLAISTDGGLTFQKKGAVISSHTPWDRQQPNMVQGVGSPTLLIDHTGKYLLCYYTEYSRFDPATGEKRKGSVRGKAIVTCMARSQIKDGGMPGTWKKYYRNSFSEPGLEGKDTEVADCWSAYVQYLPNLKKYIMVASCGCIACYQSDDGVHWSFPDPDRRESGILWKIADVAFGGGPFAGCPCFVITRTRGNNFASGKLFYRYGPGAGKPGTFETRSFVIKSL